MRTLEEVRQDIDAIDATIISAVLKRIELSGEVKRIKDGSGKAVFDPTREDEIIKRLQAQIPEEHHVYLDKMYRLIFSYSKEIQQK